MSTITRQSHLLDDASLAIGKALWFCCSVVDSFFRHQIVILIFEPI
ncbi:MAG: hypothetical protein LUO89_02505 [Methanothrix sp.]|nr:hypothetical protein [Methanothrix sp.]